MNCACIVGSIVVVGSKLLAKKWPSVLNLGTRLRIWRPRTNLDLRQNDAVDNLESDVENAAVEGYVIFLVACVKENMYTL